MLTFYREEIMKEVINKINCANRTIIRKLDSMPSFRSASDLTCKRGYILGYLIDHKNQKIYQKDLEKVFNVRRMFCSHIYFYTFSCLNIFIRCINMV